AEDGIRDRDVTGVQTCALPISFPATEVTGFSKPALEGHVGTLRSVRTPDGRHVLVIGARTHYYEGHGVRRVVHSVRTAAATGAQIGRASCRESGGSEVVRGRLA